MSVKKEGIVKGYILTIGFFGGLLSSGLSYLAHFLNFSSFGPGIILQMWPGYDTLAWMRGPYGHLLGMGLISLVSIGGAALYYLLFRRMETAWAGLWYGLALWVIIFLGLNEIIPGIQGVTKLELNTNLSLVSIFIFYGLFVGYSISYEHQQDVREERLEREEG